MLSIAVAVMALAVPLQPMSMVAQAQANSVALQLRPIRRGMLARAGPITMKGVAGFRFNLNMWYGDDDFAGKRPDLQDTWVSPWAEAHYKIRQQEVEVEQCRFLLQQAIDVEDYGEAQGLQTRIERLQNAHPLLWREERVQQALTDGNFVLANILQKDLDVVKANLGLPKFAAGQMIRHRHRPSLRGLVIDVDLLCVKPDDWAATASCLERAVAQGVPAEECMVEGTAAWRRQPFYTVLPDLKGTPWEKADDVGAGTEADLPWPTELSAWQVNYRLSQFPPPVYLSEDSIEVDFNSRDVSHPERSKLFEPGYEQYEHRGRLYRPSPRLRLWQHQQAKAKQEAKREKRYQRIGLNDGTFFLS